MLRMGMVWDRTAEFLSDHLPTLLPVALIAIFVPLSITASLRPLREVADAGLAAALVLGGIVLMAVSLWGRLAVMAMAVDPAAAAGQGRAVATRRFAAVIGMVVVMIAVLLLLAVPLAGILAAEGVRPSATAAGGWRFDGEPGGAAVAYLVGMAAVGIWLFARLALVVPVTLVERRGLGAFARSFALTRGAALRIVGVMLLYAIVAIVVSLAVRTVVGSVLTLLLHGEGPVTIASVLTAIATGAVGTAFAVLAAAFTGKLYIAARDRAERGSAA